MLELSEHRYKHHPFETKKVSNTFRRVFLDKEERVFNERSSESISQPHQKRSGHSLWNRTKFCNGVLHLKNTNTPISNIAEWVHPSTLKSKLAAL